MAQGWVPMRREGVCVEFPLRFQLVPCRFSSVADGIVGGEGRLTGHRPAADA